MLKNNPRKGDDENYIGCYTPACNAEYCVYCLPFLDNICSRCRSRLEKDVEDLSDGEISDGADLLDGDSFLKYF